MRVGIVLSSSPSYSETFFNSKIIGLQKQGVAVVLFCKKKDKDFKLCTVIEPPKVSSNVMVMAYYFIKEIVKLLPYRKEVARFVRLERKKGISSVKILKAMYVNSQLLKAKVDWLHFGFATMALERENVAQAIGAKMGVSFRGFDIAIYPLKHPNCYQYLWQKVDKIHTISNDLLQIAYTLGLPKTIPVAKITPAIDVTFFTPNTVTPLTASQPIQFLTVGRLHWKKGHIQTLQALAQLKAKNIIFTYTIVGGGTQAEQERVRFVAQELNIEDAVVFKGKLNHQAVKQAYQQADVYIQYSISEGFCNAVLEAQAMKTLCVVSSAEGLPENVLHNQTGWVVPKLSPTLLAKQLEAVYLLPDIEKEKIKQQARQRVQEQFTIQKQQKAFNKFYTQTL